MGLFDEYEPVPPIACARCGVPLKGWQGKDGPNQLFLWRQGEARALRQGFVGSPTESIETSRLPDEFGFSTVCECGHCVDVTGFAVDGVWTRNSFELTCGAVPQPHFPDEVGRRRCLGCDAVWTQKSVVVNLDKALPSEQLLAWYRAQPAWELISDVTGDEGQVLRLRGKASGREVKVVATKDEGGMQVAFLIPKSTL